MSRPHVLAMSAAMVVATTIGSLHLSQPLAAQSAVRTFKIAFYNIQSGKGKVPLPGNAGTFTDTSNCTDPAQPLNAWGVGFVQAELTARIANDPSVVALGLVEAWTCANPEAVRQALGWRSASGERNGTALLARYGFAGAEEWLQLDTSLNENPADSMWIVRRAVCLDAACSASVNLYTAHWYFFTTRMVDSYTSAETQARQSIDFMARLPYGQPQILIGDLNAFEGNQRLCTLDYPQNGAIGLLRAADYLDAWRSLLPGTDGFTGMWNYNGCGTPNGNLFKRVDYAWSRFITPIGVTRFGMVTPGQQAPSDHAGLIAEYALPTPAQAVAPPTVWIDAPADNATLNGSVSVGVTATDDEGISRVELLIDGVTAQVRAATPFTFTWDSGNVAPGPHVLTAAATDVSGNRVVSMPRHVLVQTPFTGDDEVVLYASEATRVGSAWTVADDSTAAGGHLLRNPNAGAATVSPAANPASYFELTFDADAGKPYRIWMRGRAANDSALNDSVSVQFDHSATASGAAVYRIGSTEAATINIEDCTGCGLLGWGWQDNGAERDVLGPPIYFTTSGAQRLRVQVREDGLDIDQIAISAVRYLLTSPGSTTGDRTILPKTVVVPPPPGAHAEIVLHARNATNIVGNWVMTPDATAASGARLQNVDRGAAKVTTAVANPFDAFELTFDADANTPYRLWMRGRASNDSYSNDSVFVQFDGSVNASGQPVDRIGTTSADAVVLEDCGGCGLHGWGWADNGYGTIGPPIYFARTGPQRLRVQIREDGIALDQIVLSAVRYWTTAPGLTKDDATILPATGAAPAGIDEVVLYTAAAVNVAGNWSRVTDSTAAAGVRLQSTDYGRPKVTTAAATPADVFELTFDADANKAYRLWVRGRASGDSYNNDSLYVQFDNSVDGGGQPVDRIGTASAEAVVVEDCSGCGLHGWGWADNGYGAAGAPIVFSRAGSQRLRVQVREDGIALDQIVLSAVRYRSTAPGLTKDDATILPATGGTPPPAGTADEIVLYAESAVNVSGNWAFTSDASAAAGVLLQSADLGQAKLAVPRTAPPMDSFEITFQADAGKAYTLWVRGRALADSYSNDSVYVQFDGSVDQTGQAVARIGTASAVVVIVEDAGGAGLSGWGWADDAYGTAATPVYFAQTGPQRLRVQVREDGVGVDQIVLSAVRYRTAAPGATKNDSTIVPR